MQLTPRYGSNPLIRLDGAPDAVVAPLVRHQRRFIDELGRLDGAQWAAPSRCAGWSVRDVIVHLETATSFWVLSVTQGLRGEPTQFLAAFDPVATPAQMVGASDVDGPGALERFAASVDALARALEALDTAEWSTIVEAPTGHVTVTSMAHHALWDSWVHERDVLLPLGIEAPVVDDEVTAALRYAAALSPAFAVNAGRVGGGSYAVDATDPDVAFTVVASDVVAVVDGAASDVDAVFRGRAVELAEAFSLRGGLVLASDGPAAWMLDGLREVFDQAG